MFKNTIRGTVYFESKAIDMKHSERELVPIRRILVMLFGIFIMGLGIALFKQSSTGNGPSTAMGIAIGEVLGIDFSIIIIIMNCLFFVAEALFARNLIGIGTFANWLLVGPFASGFVRVFNHYIGSDLSIIPRIGLMILGVLVLSLANALYQSADVGIAPYDSLSIIIFKRFCIPYFWARIITDSICVIITYFFGGILGIGTIICAFGLGPFISFFSKNVANPILHQSSSSLQQKKE